MPEKLDFITPTLMRILHTFLVDPMEECYEREVVRRTGVSKGSTNKILRLLANLGFLISERKGRMVFYRLDLREPVVRQFKVLINIYALEKLLSQLKQYSRRVVLFGSCARGVDVKDSDIDLFILTSEKEHVRKKISEFNRKSERKLPAIIVDANEFARLKRQDKPLNENIESGITLWEIE